MKNYVKETADLIDYDSVDFTQKLFEIRETGILLNANDNITFSKTCNELFEPYKIISFQVNDNDFILKSPESKKDLLKLNKESLNWMVFKGTHFQLENKKQYYKLSEGDILKFGRIFAKIWKINITNDNDSTDLSSEYGGLTRNLSGNLNVTGASYDNFAHFAVGKVIRFGYCEGSSNKERNSINRVSFADINKSDKIISSRNSLILPRILSEKNINNNKLSLSQNEEFPSENHLKKMKTANNKAQCRICYGTENTISNPLIHPCNCIGSLRSIHYQCLKSWLNSKILDGNNNPIASSEISYPVKEIECELCKSKYPNFIKLRGKLYNLSFYNPPYKKYMVMETIKGEKEKTRTIHIISFDNRKRVSLGRAGESDINIPDLSVSRFHSFLFIERNRIFLEDGGSKFGSLVLIQNPNLKLNSGESLKIQFKRCYFNIKIKKKFSFFSCCNALDFDCKAIYQKQNSKCLDVLRNVVVLENISSEEEEENNELNRHNNYPFPKIKINKNKRFSNLPLINVE